jgi:hypothetical protein
MESEQIIHFVIRQIAFGKSGLYLIENSGKLCNNDRENFHNSGVSLPPLGGCPC